jgi:nicotinamide-nucleotide amidase
MKTPFPEFVIGSLLLERGWKLVTAESCTGGLIGHWITNVPGSSDYYLGGVVSYSNALKMQLLGVRAGTLETYGAVSEQVALEMAQGARARLGGEVALAVTGIAGPGGGSAEKPVGLTFTGISAPWGESVARFVWSGERVENKKESARAALQMLVEALAGKQDPALG